ncbi:MAG TPA: DUF2232 domain-containing protein [Clostridia bacterium]|nr:DUF2232 domain-containing protein [Clostridia bacterium]
MEKPAKAILEGIVVGVIITLLTMVLYAVPLFNILILILPVPIVVIGIRRGTLAGILSLVVPPILIGLLGDPLLGIIMLCLSLFVVLGLTIGYKRDLGMNESVILSAGGVLLSVLLSLQVFSWMMGESFFDFLWKRMGDLLNSGIVDLKAIREFYHALGIVDKAYPADKFIEFLLSQMKEVVPLFPAMLLITSLFVGGLNFLISRWILKRLGSQTPKVPPFKRWNLPRGTGRGFLGLMLVSAIGSWVKIPNFDVVLYTISAVFTFIFTIQGLSVATFFLGERRVPGIVGVLILIATLVFLSFALTFLGIFEQIFGARKAYDSRRGD